MSARVLKGSVDFRLRGVEAKARLLWSRFHTVNLISVGVQAPSSCIHACWEWYCNTVRRQNAESWNMDLFRIY
jgi:hypothetical protein